MAKKKWKPKDGEWYYTLDGCGVIRAFGWNSNKVDISWWKVNRCFHTRTLAQAALKKIKKVLKEGKHG